GSPREDDPAPVALLRREIARLEPQKVYFPLGVGGHVDHQLIRNVGLAMIGDARRWVMPGPEWAGIVSFYEDFPYAWWNDFRTIDELDDGVRGYGRKIGALGGLTGHAERYWSSLSL